MQNDKNSRHVHHHPTHHPKEKKAAQPVPLKGDIVDLCKKHVHRYVLVQMQDGQMQDGIITEVDGEFVHLAVPEDGMSMPMDAHMGPMHTPPTGPMPQHHPMHHGPHYHMPPQDVPEVVAHHHMPTSHMGPMHETHMNQQQQQSMHLDSTYPMSGGSPDDGDWSRQADRQYWGGPWGPRPPWGPGPGYWHGPFFPRRRFRRLTVPLAAITALSLLPYFYY